MSEISMLAHSILDIDHLMIGVDDPHVTAERFRRLGFTVTPYSSLPSLGIGNILVCLRPRGSQVANFFEFMAVEKPGAVHPVMAAVLAGAPGIKTLVHSTDDVAAFRTGMIDLGLRMHDVWPIERSWALPSGEVLDFRFRVALPEPGSTPLMINACEYLTLQHYLREEFLVHPNGAQHFTHVLVDAPPERLPRTIAFFEQLYGTSAVPVGQGVTEVPARDVGIRVRAADGSVEPHYAGIVVAVTDPKRTAELLRANDIPHAEDDGALVVAAADAFGNEIRFVAAS